VTAASAAAWPCRRAGRWLFSNLVAFRVVIEVLAEPTTDCEVDRSSQLEAAEETLHLAKKGECND